MILKLNIISFQLTNSTGIFMRTFARWAERGSHGSFGIIRLLPRPDTSKTSGKFIAFSKFVKNEEDPSCWLPTATLAAFSICS